jgi:hypothetical protein
VVFDLGSVYPASLNVYDQNKNLVNATTVTLTITLPDGTSVSPAITNPPAVTGQYTYSYLTVQPGRHVVRWVTTAPNTGYTDVFDVTEAVIPSVLSLVQAKRQLEIDPLDTNDDAELREVLLAVTLAVEDYKGEIIARRSFTQRYQFQPYYWNWAQPRLRLDMTPVISLTSLISDDNGFAWDVVNNLITTPDGLVTVKAGPAISGNVTAVHVSGYTIIPYNYQMASLVVLQHVWETRRGVGGLGGSVGPEELHVAAGKAYALPKKAIELLGPPQPAVA